jgi:putative transcription factor
MESQLQCEICGKIIVNASHRIVVDGVEFIVCNECMKLKSTKPVSGKPPSTPELRRPKIAYNATPKPRSSSLIDFEIVDNYGQIIRQAREKLGLTHEKLGEKINEKASVVKKVENKNLTPDKALALKLEHFLGIKLLKPLDEFELRKVEETISPPKHDRTLGDIVVIKKRRK